MAAPLHEYTPWGVFTPVTMGTRDDVTFVCGADSITLKNPTFGNSDTVDVTRTVNISRGNTPNVFRDSIWPERTEMSISFEALKRVKALELLDFLKNCIGLLVTYTDPDDRVWEGIILNPESAVTEDHIERYSAEIVLSATLV